MSILAVVGNKGGTGKTTLTLNLAAGLSRQDSVVIVDADPQQSAYQWRLIGDERSGLPAVVAAAYGLGKTVGALREAHTHVVIDCPPSIKAPQTEHALRIAEYVLIPVQPSPMDLWATSHIARIIEKMRQENPGLRALIVMSQTEPRTTLSRLMPEAARELDLPVARASLRRRSIHRHCVLEGRSVFQAGRRGEAAAAEINDLITEIFSPST
ncbi:ParA family partition ATPase [Thioalkalivibrio paradoxus]|uniref:Cobyrinic acid a,c-diamide synthase n=1 Tax=Thioalkalivibrio paradoxus ARh 1 TaxID=713585 RepID=W0DPL4_9GAMM|nr:ParA family partition ATPase [Thioalkalivibrio paradoxus]AHE98948.1 cobyrinic acid a,c-diamide synthase [Thioalkalivibrio paradoxus ARh 1]